MPDSALFDLGGALRIRIRGPSRGALPDLNRKFRAFAVPDQGPADIEAEIGPFVPDAAGTTHVDHQYRIREGHISFGEDIGGVRFRCEISSLHGPTTRVRFQGRPSGSPAERFLYPDLAFHNHVLQPLAEAKLGLRGLFLLHAAGVSRNGRAALLIGRGMSYKTTYAFRLVREGMAFLGDDLVMFGGGRVLPFPVHAGLFGALAASGIRDESQVRGARKAALAWRLGRGPDRTPPLSGPARPERALLFDIVSGRERPEAFALEARAAAAKAGINARMEWEPERPAKYRLGNFLDAYHLIFPGNPLDGHWERHGAALRGLLQGAACHRIETAPGWSEAALGLVRGLADPERPDPG
jgi:hypothetical protein